MEAPTYVDLGLSEKEGLTEEKARIYWSWRNATQPRVVRTLTRRILKIRMFDQNIINLRETSTIDNIATADAHSYTGET